MIPFDELRAKYPHLGFALYAYQPDGPVTLECITPEQQTFTFLGATAEAAMAEGFPEDLQVSASPPAPETSADPTTDKSVFD
jgi:hypothetical protein